MNKSEVARMRAAIEAECEAMAHMAGPQRVGGHREVIARYENLGTLTEQLAQATSDQEANTFMVDAYARSMSK
jgi:hypothetical protein